MLNDFLNPKFDIEITNRNGRVEAFCPVFPDCFGIGDNEKKAIEDLADSIALYLGEVVKGTVNDIIKGGVLRHVDPVKEIKNKKKDILLSGSEQQKKNTFVFPSSNKSDMEKFEKLFNNYDHKKPIMRGGLLSILGLPQMNMDRKESGMGPRFMSQAMPEYIENPIDFYDQYGIEEIKGSEGILLGIPLSFN